MALFRRNNSKQVTKMTFEQLQDRLAELTQARFVIDIELSEVLGEIKNMETLAKIGRAHV